MIQIIIFDLGNVLIHVDPRKTLPYFMKKLKKIPEEVIYKYLYESSLLRDYEKGYMDDRAFINGVRDQLQVRFSDRFFRKCWNGILSPIQPVMDLIPVLCQQYQLMALSNSNKMHIDFCMKQFPVLSRFHDMILSYGVGFCKPEPEMFQIALERSKCPAEQVLFIDDLSENVAGAKKTGMQAVQFKGYHNLIQTLAKFDIHPDMGS